jgi:hypothetical protein
MTDVPSMPTTATTSTPTPSTPRNSTPRTSTATRIPTIEAAPPSAPSTPRVAARWMVSFVGFPLGGLAAKIIVGPVVDPRTALLGGLLTGAVLGAAQAFGLGRYRPSAIRWVTASAFGLMLGLGLAATATNHGTTFGALAVQGALCGLALGVTQAFVLRPRLGRIAFAWAPALAAIWALGWTVTTAIGVQVDQHFTVFGSSGALTVSALTVVLPLALRRAASTPR